MKPSEFLRSIRLHLPHQLLSVYAGNAAFFLLLSMFPLAVMLLTLLQYVPATQTDLFLLLQPLVPTALLPLLTDLTAELPMGRTAVLSFSAVAALWSASKGLYSLMCGLNAVLGVKQTRRYILRRVLCLVYTLLTLLGVVLTLSIFVLGKQLLVLLSQHAQPLYRLAVLLLRHLRLFAAGLLSGFFCILYLVLPDRRSSFFRVLPGALAAAAAWLLFSHLFSYYTGLFSGRSALYGSLNIVILAMLWLYFCLCIFFYGAFFNRLLFRTKPRPE